jgi:DNA modification methylase
MRWNRGGGAAVWRFPPMKSATEVATQKPLNLIEAFVSDFSERGETVLDPFVGSGTTGAACVHQGRSFIGIERNPRHFDIACRRIEDAQRQGRLIA